MTGYGKVAYSNGSLQCDVEIKTLNSKSFDYVIRTNLPLNELELKIVDILRLKLLRGKIDCNIKIKIKNRPTNNIFNTDAIVYYADQIKEISWLLFKKKSFEDTILETVLKMPNVLESSEIDISVYEKEIIDSVSYACDKVNSYRETEGKKIEIDICENLTLIETKLKEIENFEKNRIEKIKQRLIKTFEEANLQMDNNRFATEVLYYLEKIDINEEKQRIKSHIDYFRKIIEQEKECGKKLNFVTQEIHRELTTLSNKANDENIQILTVDMREACEKIREQLQNVL